MSSEEHREDREERNLRRLMSELRSEDALQAPRFADTWGAARQQQAEELAGARRYRWLAPLPVGVAAVVLLAVSLITFWPGAGDPSLSEADPSLADWNPPSTSFLELDEGLLDLGLVESATGAGDEGLVLDLPTDSLLLGAFDTELEQEL